MGAGKTILVVEDETDLSELLEYNLTRNGYDVVQAADGLEAINRARAVKPDLIILDLMIPKISGLEVSKEIRANPDLGATPILMLTARAEEEDELTGLRAGADDYVTKPFSLKVLLARVESLLRRSAPAEPADRVECGPLVADVATHEIALDGETLKLTLTEFKLLIAMMRSDGRVLSRKDLIQEAMGPGISVTARTIDVHVAAIRKKLGRHGEKIRTVRGVGYRMVENEPDRVGTG